MTKDKALKLALEALGHFEKAGLATLKTIDAITAIRDALAQPEQEPVAYSYTSRITGAQGFSHHPMPRFIDSESWDIKSLYTQQYTYIAPTHQKPFGWKLVPIEPTNEMLKAMDECSTEGYDERLLAGHASSVYMAAVDVAPTPPQPEQNQFNPDWDAMAVMVEEQQRMAKRIAELEAQQEPVAWLHTKIEGVAVPHRPADLDKHPDRWEALYKTPPPCPTCEALARTVMLDQTYHDAQRKPLTDEEIWKVVDQCKGGRIDFARAIEAAHNIKE